MIVACSMLCVSGHSAVVWTPKCASTECLTGYRLCMRGATSLLGDFVRDSNFEFHKTTAVLCIDCACVVQHRYLVTSYEIQTLSFTKPLLYSVVLSLVVHTSILQSASVKLQQGLHLTCGQTSNDPLTLYTL